MPILNYTTEISVAKTAGEIQEILARAGANRVMIEFGIDRVPSAVSFQIDFQGQPISYHLPTRWQGVYQALRNNKDVPARLKTEAQAKKVGWRIVKDWINSQCAMIEAGTAELTEVFLPYMLNNKNQTMFDVWKDETLALGSGEVIEGEVQ